MTLNKQKHENNLYLSNSQHLKLTSTKGSSFATKRQRIIWKIFTYLWLWSWPISFQYLGVSMNYMMLKNKK